jgi:hypothetical protein
MRSLTRWLTVPLLATLGIGCAGRFVPDTESALPPPVAIQQEMMAGAIDDAFAQMDFSRLKNAAVEIEVVGVYLDGDVADYLRSRLQLELAKVGCRTEIDRLGIKPDYKANLMVRVGGADDVTHAAPFYSSRTKIYRYDVQVAVTSFEGKDFFTQSGKGEREILVDRRVDLLFIPIPLHTEYRLYKGTCPLSRGGNTYSGEKHPVKNAPKPPCI